MPRIVPTLVFASGLAGLLAVASPAGAATYTVVSATHSSSASKTDLPYEGTSSSRWSLEKPSKDANNRFSVSKSGKVIQGAGIVNVRGVFEAKASTGSHSCSLSVTTGSEKHSAVAPQPVGLALATDREGRRVFTFTGMHATLGNPYFGTGCTTSLTGQPGADTTSRKRVKASLFRKERFTLSFAGSSNDGGIAYDYSTTFQFVRLR
jgi:hypothetical protein